MKTIRKALTAGVFAAAAAVGAAMLDGDITTAELVVSGGMGLGALAATYQIKNAG
jgi:hypothetical protein